MKQQNKRLIFSAIVVLLVICFIFSNSLLDGNESNQRSGMVMKLLQRILDPDHSIDEEIFHHFVRKGAHFSEFALLGASLVFLMRNIRNRFDVHCPGIALFSALAVAVTDEFIQSFTGRTSSVKDVLIDFSGALFAMILLWMLFRIKRAINHK